MKPSALSAFVLAFAACTSAGCTTYQIQWPLEPTREAAGSDEVSRMLRDAVASGALCERLKDQYLPVPVEGAWAPGTAPAAGRWHVRECSAQAVGSDILLHIAGDGWTWADKSKSGFRVQQYIGFEASADVRGSFDLAYDEDHKLATVWLAPTSPASVRFVSKGPIKPKPQNIATQIVAWIAPSFVQGEAREAVTDEGTRTFQMILNQGVTLTVDVARNFQMDLLPGLLPKGIRPARPFGTTAQWIVNERQFLATDGVHITGPMEAGEYVFESNLESGNGVEALALCVDDVNARSVEPRQLGHFEVETRRTAAIISAPCRFYMITQKRGQGGATVSIMISRRTAPAQ